MATQFHLKDERRGDVDFRGVSRKLYKKVATVSNKFGALIRTGTEYHDGTPCKYLTLLKRIT